MGRNSELHIQMQEAGAMIMDDPGCAMLPGEIQEALALAAISGRAESPYMQRHGMLLDQRNLYRDLCAESLTLASISPNRAAFWQAAYERQCAALAFIEGKLLEVENAVS